MVTGSTPLSNAASDALDNKSIGGYVEDMKNAPTIYKTTRTGRQRFVLNEVQVSYQTKPWPRWFQWFLDLIDKLEARRLCTVITVGS